MLWGASLFGLAVLGLLFWLVTIAEGIQSTVDQIERKINPPKYYEGEDQE